MGNCLVTKLKGVVDNDNLDYLGFVAINVNARSGVVKDNVLINVLSMTSQDDVKVLTPGVNLYFNPSNGYLTVLSDTVSGPIKILVDKYKCTYFRNLNNDAVFNLGEIMKFPNLERIEITGGDNGSWWINKNTSHFNGNTKITNLTCYNDAIEGNLSDIATMTQLTTLSLNYCHLVLGDLSLIKDLPNLTTVTLNHVQISDNDNTVAYLQNRGVTVTYVHD